MADLTRYTIRTSPYDVTDGYDLSKYRGGTYDDLLEAIVTTSTIQNFLLVCSEDNVHNILSAVS